MADLSPGQGLALDTLLRSLPNPAPSPGADRFRYKIKLLNEQGQREIDVSEDAMPDELASIPKIDL